MITATEFAELNTTLRVGLTSFLSTRPATHWGAVLFVLTTSRNRQGFLVEGDTIDEMLEHVRTVAKILRDTAIEYAAIVQVAIATKADRNGNQTTPIVQFEVLRASSLSMEGHRADWMARINRGNNRQIVLGEWQEGEPITQTILENFYTDHQKLNPPPKSTKAWRPDEPTLA